MGGNIVHKNPLAIVIAASLAIFAFIAVLNARVSSSLKEKSLESEKKPARIRPLERSQETVGEADKRSPNKVPETGEAPGIYVQGEEKGFWTDAAWDAYVGKNFEEANLLDKEPDSRLFKNMQKTPENFKKRLEYVNLRIKDLEEQKGKDPYSIEIQKKLENLYGLRSTLLVLEDKITETPAEPR